MRYTQLANSFREGEVMYGLRDPLFEAVSELNTKRHRKVASFYFGVLPGIAGKATAILQADLTDAVWDRDKPAQYASNRVIGKRLVDSSKGRGFRDFLANHERYNVAQQYATSELDPNLMVTVRKAWGRTSKGALEFHLGRGSTVHFLVDGLNFNEIAEKIFTGSKAFITAKEIRWLYRHRNVPQVQRHLRFWEPDREVPQFEIWNHPAWQHYSPKNNPIDLKRTQATPAPKLELDLGASFGSMFEDF